MLPESNLPPDPDLDLRPLVGFNDFLRPVSAIKRSSTPLYPGARSRLFGYSETNPNKTLVIAEVHAEVRPDEFILQDSAVHVLNSPTTPDELDNASRRFVRASTSTHFDVSVADDSELDDWDDNGTVIHTSTAA